MLKMLRLMPRLQNRESVAKIGFVKNCFLPFFFLIAALFFGEHATAQTVVTIGAGSQTGTSSNGATGDPGPIYRSTATSDFVYSRYHYLYTQAELIAAGVPGGVNITKLAWNKDLAAATNSPATFQIWIKNSTKTTVGAGGQNWTDLITGSTQVYNNPALNLASAPQWHEFDFSTPFLYTGDAIEISINFDISSGTSPWTTAGFSWKKDPITDRTLSYVGATPPGVTLPNLRTVRPQLQLTYVPAGPCTAPPTAGTASANVTTVCANTNFNLSLTGSSFGTGQTFQWETSATGTGGWTPIGTAGTSTGLTTTQTAGTHYYRAAVTCSGQTSYSNVVSVVSPALISGTFTINKNGTATLPNFLTFTDAINYLSCGINGPVILNVVANTGPYTEQFEIPQIGGMTAANTITINGNGNTISADPATGNRSIIRLNGADYVTINNFTIQTTGTTTTSFGWGIHFMNGANFNTISNNTINIGSLSTTESNSGGIIFSNSLTTATTTGDNGNNNIISGNTITGGYKGIGLYGLAANTGANQISNNTISDFYNTGIDLGGANATVVENNNISRPTRVTVTTFEGIALSGATQNSIISKNRIHNSHGGASALTGDVYGIYSTANDAPVGSPNIVKNNLIYGINNTAIIYGLYNSGSNGVYYYHNTINLDNAANTGVNRGFYQTTTATDIKLMNNIFRVAGGSSGVKHAIYYGTVASTIDSDRNVLWQNGGATGSGLGFYTTNQVTLADWRTASGDDLNSVSADPLFAGAASGNFIPTNVTINNIGAPVVPAVTDDFAGNPRNATTPDPGAYEFTVSPTDLGAIALASPVVKACYGNAEQVTVTIKNWGSSPIDFTTNNATITVPVTGGATTTLTITLNNNTLNGGQPLAPGATLDVPVGTLNMAAAGAYTFNASATVTGDANATNNAMTATTITTVAVTAGTASASPATICQSGTTTLTLTGAAGGNIQWQQGTSATGPFTNITGATTASFTLAAPISQTTYYQAIVSCGANTANSNVLTVTVNNPQVASVTGGTRCGSGPVTLTATPSAGTTISWFAAATGGAPLATGNTYTPTVTATTTYYAQASVGSGSGITSLAANPMVGGNGCGGGNMFNITPTANITVTGFDMNLGAASGTSVPVSVYYKTGTYLGNETTAAAWTFHETVNATAAGPNNASNIQITPLSLSAGQLYGIYLVADVDYTNITGPVTFSNADLTIEIGAGLCSLFGGNNPNRGWNGTVYYSAGCGGTRVPVIATVTPGPATPTITVAAGGSTTFCTGGSVTLNGASATAGATYRWSLNGAPIAGATTASYTATQAGNYRVIASNGTCSDSSAVTTVTINPIPATPTITQAGNTLTSSATVGNQWYSVSGTTLTPIPGATGTTFTPTASGTYTVRVTTAGCLSVAAASVTVTITGMEALAPGMAVSIYPNPTAGKFAVNLVGFEKEATIQIINVTGQIISSERVTITANETSKAFNLGGMAKGVYILKVTSGNNLTFRKVILD